MVNEGTVMDVVYLHFGKTLDTVFYEVLIDELMNYRSNNWIVI